MIRLGGVSVYAPCERKLDEGLQLLGGVIVEQSTVLPSIERRALHTLVCEKLDEEVDDRLFGAVLGSQMRMGLIEGIGCAALSGKVFRVLVNAELTNLFQKRLSEVLDRLRTRHVLLVREVRDDYFPRGEWGTWSAANHLLARLTQIGCATYVDKYTYAWPKGLESAFG
jgi:hypothetical protein